jgi:hypothetical protein
LGGIGKIPFKYFPDIPLIVKAHSYSLSRIDDAAAAVVEEDLFCIGFEQGAYLFLGIPAKYHPGGSVKVKI